MSFYRKSPHQNLSASGGVFWCGDKYRGDLLAVGGFFVLTIAFFWQFLDGSVVLAFKDLSRYFYPLRQLMVEQVKSGYLPLWNPYLFCGFPLLATLQVGFFYPLTVIHYLLPFSLAFNYYTIAHYFLAACFMYALLRHYQLSRPAAFFGGLVFTFSGYLLSVSNMNTSLSSVIWLPLALLLVDRLTAGPQDRRTLTLVLLSCCLAVMFLGGEPTILYVSAWFLAAYVLVFSAARWRDLLALAAAFVLAAGLVAVQLIPFIELIRLSDRMTLTSYDLISFRSLPPREIINFILPYFFGNASVLGGYSEVLIGKNNQDWLISIYFGIIPIVLAFFAWGRRKAGFFAAAAAVSLLLACGRYTWFYQGLFHIVPGISLVRYPVKYLFLMTFCAAVLAAFGLESLVNDRAKQIKAARIFGWCAALALLIALPALLFVDRIFAYFCARYSANIPKVFFNSLFNIIKFDLQSAISLAGYSAGAAIVFWFVYRQKLSRRAAVFWLILIAAADLLANGSSVAVGVPARLFEEEPANYRLLRQERELGRLFYTKQVENNNSIIYGPNYTDALQNTRDKFAANWFVPYHLFDFHGYESIEPLKLTALLWQRLYSDKYKETLPELSKYNVRFILSAERLRLPGFKSIKKYDDCGQCLYIYRNEKAKPRAYLVKGKGSVAIVSYRPGRITLWATAETAAKLFLSESSYPGWKFLVDGKFAGVPRPQALFCAVDLQPGEHRVEFVYDPLSFKLGALISGLTVLLLGGLLWAQRINKWGG